MAKNEPKIYHHSNAKGIAIRIVAIVIAAAFILALTAFFGFRKFIAYTDTGKLYLDIPWLYGYMDGPPKEDDLLPYLSPAADKSETPPTDTDTDDSENPDENDENAPTGDEDTVTP